MSAVTTRLKAFQKLEPAYLPGPSFCLAWEPKKLCELHSGCVSQDFNHRLIILAAALHDISGGTSRAVGSFG